jgi:hypothetical protein
MPANPIPLSTLRIDKPCSQNWQSMQGDDRRRFCAQCQHHVHNLSALTEREVQKLIATTEGRLCGMIVRDSSGRVVTQRDQGLHARLRRRLSAWRLGLSSALASTLTTAGFAEKPSAPPPATSAQTPRDAQPANVATSPPTPAGSSSPSSAAAEGEDTIILVGFIVNTPPAKKPKKSDTASPCTHPTTSDDATILLPALGEMRCEKPKPPVQKKYKK